MSNLKLDIIYYKTSTDFEMEFNLNGCCRMRIFKDKVETPKDLVKTLARDVSRSKIIIVVTDLAGYENGVELVSKSVGLSLCSLNKTEFGVQSGEDILLPKNAVPLVNKSGIYGGCILESGPQSIIIVSSVRSLRHEIMKAYVHNYIFDVAQIEAYNERMGGNPSEGPLAAMSDNNDSSQIETAVKTDGNIIEEEPVTSDIADVDTIDETSVDIENDEQKFETNLEEASEEMVEENDVTVVNSPFVISEEPFLADATPGDNTFEDLPSDSKLHKKSRYSKPSRRGLNIVLLIFAVLILVCIGVLTYFFIYLPLIGVETSFFGEENFITDFIKEYFMN